MAGLADWAFREICYGFGAEIAVSEPLPVPSLLASPRRLLPQVQARHGVHPFIVQLIGCRPEEFRRAAGIVADNLPVVGIDINMGCPVSSIVKAGKGSALLREPARAVEIVSEVCAGTSLPVSVKLRNGWDSVVAPDLARSFEAAGARALVIHGRTREQHYSGTADLEVIAAVKRAVSIPVVGSGDVVSVSTAHRMLAATGVDGIMVGRGALGHPWLFAELQADLKHNCRFKDKPFQRGEVVRRHVQLVSSSIAPDRAVRAVLGHLVAYSLDSPARDLLRQKLAGLHSLDDIERWITFLEEARQ
jgi:nifR3 family TIM-barrel protein